MHTTEHTDLDGDALTVHRDKGLAWVTITRDGDELTVGPVPAHALTEQHRSSHTRDEKRNAESRPLTPTDEMVERARSAYWGPTYGGNVNERVRAILAAALAEPPTRPEGAERWEDFLIDSLDYQALTDQQIADLADRIAEEMNR